MLFSQIEITFVNAKLTITINTNQQIERQNKANTNKFQFIFDESKIRARAFLFSTFAKANPELVIKIIPRSPTFSMMASGTSTAVNSVSLCESLANENKKTDDFSKRKTITNKRAAQVLFGGAHLFCFDFIHKTDKLQAAEVAEVIMQIFRFSSLAERSNWLR